MFTSGQYRAKADHYDALARAARGNDEKQEFQNLHRSFAALADNQQWLSDNYDRTVHADDGLDAEVLATEEEHILRCLGAAVVMQWSTLPTGIQKTLFDNAGAIGTVPDVKSLRAQIAQFLHNHKTTDAAR